MARLDAAAIGAALWLAAGAAQAGGMDEDRPPNARPGQCYAKVVSAEVFETVPERRLVAPERIERRLIPAEFGWRDKQVVVRPARIEHYPVPPTFRMVTETVVVQPPTFRREVIPPIYEPVARQVLVREPRTVWKPGRALSAYGQGGYGHGGYGYAPEGYGRDWRGQTQVTPTGEVMCLVVEPALYRTVVEQVLRVPERVIDHPVPAVVRHETRQVVDRQGYDATREIPAEYGMVREKVLVRAEREESYTVPAVYETVPQRRLVSPARTEWREIACAVPPPPPPSPPLACASPCGSPPMRRYAPPPPRMHHVRPASAPRPHVRVKRRHYVRPAPRCGVCTPGAVEYSQAPRAEPATPGRPMVRELQSALAGRGYYKGPVNGVHTPATRDALVRFQRDKRLDARGELTRETAQELALPR